MLSAALALAGLLVLDHNQGMKKILSIFVVGVTSLMGLSLKPAPPFVASNVYVSPSGVINIEVECPTQVPVLALTVPANRTVIIERVRALHPTSYTVTNPIRAYVVRAGQSAEINLERGPLTAAGWAGQRVVLTGGDELYASAADNYWVRFEGTWE